MQAYPYSDKMDHLCSVHDDIQLCQWLRKRDGTLKLGDFNRAEIMDYDEEGGEYCLYNNGHGYGNVSFYALKVWVCFLLAGSVGLTQTGSSDV